MKKIITILMILAALTLIVYFGAGWYIYDTATRVHAGCQSSGSREIAANTPTLFIDRATHVAEGRSTDLEPYFMPDFEAVTFPARDDTHISISGWYVPAAVDDAPAVIVVHGLNTCKADSTTLLIGGMLHREGFNVLLIDMRDHGASTVEDGRYAGGTSEYRDVLGAWDWLQAAKGIAPERIGIMGLSGGAATVLVAYGEEPRIAAAWSDSSFAGMHDAILAELERRGFPTFLADSGITAARVLGGIDISTRSPLQSVKAQAGRPLFITHGTSDNRLTVQYAYDLQAQAADSESWIVEGVDHVDAAFIFPDEYQQRISAFFRAALG